MLFILPHEAGLAGRILKNNGESPKRCGANLDFSWRFDADETANGGFSPAALRSAKLRGKKKHFRSRALQDEKQERSARCKK